MATILYRGRCKEGLICEGMDFGCYIPLYSHLYANLEITHLKITWN